MSGIHSMQIGLYSEQRYLQSELKIGGLAAVKPFKSFSAGAAVSYYGFTAFNQQRYTLSMSKSLSKTVRLGVQGQYLTTFIQDYGSAGNWVLGLGLQVIPVRNIILGMVLFNPTQAKYGTQTSERIPAYARLGCTYQVSDKVKLMIEADQQLEQQLCWRGGVQYHVHEVLTLALGAAARPTYYTFGVGLKVNTFQLDLASGIHEVLGFTPHLGLTMPIQK